MKKVKFDSIELNILINLINRKLEKLNETTDIDEFYMDYKGILENLRDKINKISER